MSLITRAMFRPAPSGRKARNGGSRYQRQMLFSWPAWRTDPATAAWQVGDFSNYAHEGFELNALIYGALMYKFRAQQMAPLRGYQGDLNHPEPLAQDDPLAQMLARPNPYQSWFEFQGLADIYLNLSGNCFILAIRGSASGPATKMQLLRPDRVYIVPDRTQGLKGYLLVPEGQGVQDGIPILVEDLWHVKLPNPLDPLDGLGYGLSPLASLSMSADVDNTVTGFLRQFFKYGAMPPGILKYDVPMNEEDVDLVKARWAQKYGGSEHWTDIAVLDQGGDYQRVGFTFKEMGFAEIDERNESRILGPLGVPPILLGTRTGLQRSTFSNAEQAERAFWQSTFLPELWLFEAGYQALLNDPQRKRFVRFDTSGVPALQKEIGPLVEAFSKLCTWGVPAHIAASMVGLNLPQIPTGDIGFLPSGVVPAESLVSGSGQGAGGPSGASGKQSPFEADGKARKYATDQPRDDQGRFSSTGGGGSASNIATYGGIDRMMEMASHLPDKNYGVWAVRYTNNWEADKARGYSYADWGYAGGESEAEVREQFGEDVQVIYEEGRGVYMPVLNGLSVAGTDWQAPVAVEKGLGWSGSAPYKYIVLFGANISGQGTDGEDLVQPTGEAYIFGNAVDSKSAKYDPAQPRDDQGRFSSTGGYSVSGVDHARPKVQGFVNDAKDWENAAAYSLLVDAANEVYGKKNGKQLLRIDDDAGALIGFSLSSERTIGDERIMEVELLGSGYQGRGGGTRALAAACSAAARKGLPLELTAKMSAAGFYEKCGMAKSGRLGLRFRFEPDEADSFAERIMAGAKQKSLLDDLILLEPADGVLAISPLAPSGGERVLTRTDELLADGKQAKSLPIQRKRQIAQAIERTAGQWEPAFTAAALSAFESDKRELLVRLGEEKARCLQRKATVNWQQITGSWADIWSQAQENWRQTFAPAISGIIEAQAQNLSLAFGGEFDVRSLLAEEWLDSYTLQFAQPIVDDTKAAISDILLQAHQEGWAIPTMQKRLTTLFQQWMTGNVPAEDFEWYQKRLPPHRTENIVRSETMRASNAGADRLYREWGVGEREWLATQDDRTRPEHLAANGQIRPMDQPFDVGGEKLMFPGDPQGSPKNTCQCRCTVLPVMVEATGQAPSPGKAFDPGQPRNERGEWTATGAGSFGSSPVERLRSGEATLEDIREIATAYSGVNARRASLAVEFDDLSRQLLARSSPGRLATLRARQVAISEEFSKLDGEHRAQREEFSKALTVANPAHPVAELGQVAVSVEPAAQNSTLKIANKALARVGQLVDQGVAPETVATHVLARGERSFQRAGQMYMAAGSGFGDTIHEFGHVIEYGNPAVRQAAQRFLADRTAGQAATSLQGLGYDPGEVARPDTFFDPYVGKVYGSGATEVVSMGLQRYANDPLDFAVTDPAHFHLIYQIAHGSVQ